MQTKDITDRMVCEAVSEYNKDPHNNPFPYVALSKKTGCAEKVAFRAMERADDRGLIDYGVSLRTAWLTETGENLVGTIRP